MPATAPPVAQESSAEAPADAVVVGRIAGAWGVRGWLRVAPFNDPRDSVLTGQHRWWLRLHGRVQAMDIGEVRVHGRSLLARADGLDTREQAQALEGAEVLVSRSAFPVAQAGEFYWVDLIGCAVRNPAGEPLGVVSAIEEYGAHPVLRLEAGAGAAQRLIPFVPRHILAVDLPERSIVADWPLEY